MRRSSYIKRYKEAYKTNTLKQYVAGDRLVRQWIIEACKEYGITATIEGSLDLKLNLTQMADGFSGQEHSFPIMPLYKDVVQFVVRTKTFYTPTILVAYGAPWIGELLVREREPGQGREAAPLHSLGTARHDGAPPRAVVPAGRVRAHEARSSRSQTSCTPADARRSAATDRCRDSARTGKPGTSESGGLTPHETLRVVTLFGAEAIGLQQDVGSLEAGKLADLLVLDRNPLENIKNTNSIRYVMKNGEIYEGDTLNQIWPAQKTLPKPFWTEDGPK